MDRMLAHFRTDPDIMESISRLTPQGIIDRFILVLITGPLKIVGMLIGWDMVLKRFPRAVDLAVSALGRNYERYRGWR